MDTLDALGDPIVIGHPYGYSTSAGGWSKTVVGIVTKITSIGRVTMEGNHVNAYLYGKQHDRSWAANSGRSTIGSQHVFPLTMDQYNKRKESDGC